MSAREPAGERRFGVQPGEPLWFARARVVERHLGAIAALVAFPIETNLVALFVVSYLIRMWGMEAVYHRYISHRAYRVSRPVQLVLAIIGTQCGQRGPLWWAAMHRRHHRHVETPDDPHSPSAHSWVHAHFLWFVKPENMTTDLDAIPDLARFGELRWLNRYFWVPLYSPALLLTLAGHLGWLGTGVTALGALCWGFFLPSLVALHMPSFVNSAGHLPRVPGGYRRYHGRDGSTNRPLLALLTLGSGWHNNHHRYASAARAGFAWYELDITYCSLLLLRALGVVRALKRVPARVRAEGGL